MKNKMLPAIQYLTVIVTLIALHFSGTSAQTPVYGGYVCADFEGKSGTAMSKGAFTISKNGTFKRYGLGKGAGTFNIGSAGVVFFKSEVYTEGVLKGQTTGGDTEFNNALAIPSKKSANRFYLNLEFDRKKPRPAPYVCALAETENLLATVSGKDAVYQFVKQKVPFSEPEKNAIFEEWRELSKGDLSNLGKVSIRPTSTETLKQLNEFNNELVGYAAKSGFQVIKTGTANKQPFGGAFTTDSGELIPPGGAYISTRGTYLLIVGAECANLAADGFIVDGGTTEKIVFPSQTKTYGAVLKPSPNAPSNTYFKNYIVQFGAVSGSYQMKISELCDSQTVVWAFLKR